MRKSGQPIAAPSKPMPPIDIHNQTHPLTKPLRVKYCHSFGERLRGLMFRAPIGDDDGALLDQSRESYVDAAIHMFFVGFDLGIVWLDARGRVVDTRLARSWRPFYIPARPARYVLEVHPSRLNNFSAGDALNFEGLPLV
jgi:uncharacterized protein